MYEIGYSTRAKEQIALLPTQKIKDQIEAAIQRLATHPELGKILHGNLHGFWAYRSGNYRIVYQILRGELRVMIVSLGHRKDIYKQHD